MYPGALPLPEQGTLFAVSHSGEASSGIGCHRCYSACCGEMTKGEVISNPGRRLALCVAPYFADRGVGDMRGPQTAPQYATPEVVAGCHCTAQPCGTQDDTRQSTAGAQPRTTSGVRLRSSDLACPACRHDPAWRNTGFRTAATTSGVAEMLASGHCLRRGRDADAAHVGNVERGTL